MLWMSRVRRNKRQKFSFGQQCPPPSAKSKGWKTFVFFTFTPQIAFFAINICCLANTLTQGGHFSWFAYRLCPTTVWKVKYRTEKAWRTVISTLSQRITRVRPYRMYEIRSNKQSRYMQNIQNCPTYLLFVRCEFCVSQTATVPLRSIKHFLFLLLSLLLFVFALL